MMWRQRILVSTRWSRPKRPWPNRRRCEYVAGVVYDNMLLPFAMSASAEPPTHHSGRPDTYQKQSARLGHDRKDVGHRVEGCRSGCSSASGLSSLLIYSTGCYITRM